MYELVFILLAVLALLWFAISLKSRWQERARLERQQNESTRKAQTIKSRIVFDTDFRRRVRKFFRPR